MRLYVSSPDQGILPRYRPMHSRTSTVRTTVAVSNIIHILDALPQEMKGTRRFVECKRFISLGSSTVAIDRYLAM